MVDHREKPFPLKPIDEKEFVGREYDVRFVLPDGRFLESKLSYFEIKNMQFGRSILVDDVHLRICDLAVREGDSWTVPVEMQMASSYRGSAGEFVPSLVRE